MGAWRHHAEHTLLTQALKSARRSDSVEVAPIGREYESLQALERALTEQDWT